MGGKKNKCYSTNVMLFKKYSNLKPNSYLNMFSRINNSNNQSYTKKNIIVCANNGKRDDLLNKRRNKATSISFSNKKAVKWQEVNLQRKKIYWEPEKRCVKLRLSTKALKTIDRNGLSSMAKDAKISLFKLSFVDSRSLRLTYLETNSGKVPRPKNTPNKMKSLERIKTSTKKTQDAALFWWAHILD